MVHLKEKFPWQDKIINPHVLGGIETAVSDNGLAKGTRFAWINTGSGLRYKVVIYRAMDIVDAFYNQYSLTWLSHAGVSAPRPNTETFAPNLSCRPYTWVPLSVSIPV